MILLRNKEFSETKGKVEKKLNDTSNDLGLDAGVGIGTAGYYGLKAAKKGINNVGAYEGRTLGEMLKNKEIKNAAGLVKRGLKNSDLKYKGRAGNAFGTAASIAVASLAAGGAGKLLKSNKDNKTVESKQQSY